MNIDKKGLSLGILGGIGLGLLLGSEFSGTMITLIGAGIIFIFLALMLVAYLINK